MTVDSTTDRAADKKQVDFAVAYMHKAAVRNRYIELLTHWFDTLNDVEIPAPIVAAMVDDLLNVNPEEEFTKMMERNRA